MKETHCIMEKKLLQTDRTIAINKLDIIFSDDGNDGNKHVG